MQWQTFRDSQSGRSSTPAASVEPKGWSSHESFHMVVAHPGDDRPTRRAQVAEPPVYEVNAVRYGTCPGCPVSFLVQGAEPQRKVDLAMTFWVLKGPDGRTVLVDAGFYRPQFFEAFKGIVDYTRPDRAVGRLGIKPEEVTDVIVTHMHSDHVDGVDLFPKATVWIQKDEFNHYTARSSRRPAKAPDRAG